MKKALPLLALLVVLASVVAFTMRRTGGVVASFPASRSAELAPADAMLYLEVPDWDRTRARWEQSDLARMTREPEGQMFLKSWMQQRAGDGELAALVRLLPELGKLEPSGGFLALTGIDEPLPRLVCGFPYRAKKGEVEGAVRAAKEEMLKNWPGMKSELSSHRGIEIETLTGVTSWERYPVHPAGNFTWVRSSTPALRVRPKPAPPRAAVTMHLTFRDDWVFFATDRALLETLDRYLRGPEATPSLATLPAFVECRKQDVPEPDIVAWVPWVGAGKKFPLALLPNNLLTLVGAANPLRAVQYSVRLDGPNQLYFLLTTPPRAPALVNNPLALTRFSDRALLTVNFDALRGQELWMQAELSDNDYFRNLEPLLKSPGLGDPWEAFGPELAFVIREKESGYWADFVVALEVRDETKARKFAEAIARNGESLKVTSEGDTTRWIWQNRDGTNRLAPLVLTKKYLFFGMPYSGVDDVAWRAGREGPTLQTNPAFADSMEKLRAPNGAVLYLNPETFFKNNRLKLPWLSRIQNGIRLSNSLQIDRMNKHTRPGMVNVREVGTGWVVESDLNAIGTAIVIQLLEGYERP